MSEQTKTDEYAELREAAKRIDQEYPNWRAEFFKLGEYWAVTWGDPTDDSERYAIDENGEEDLWRYIERVQPPAVLALLDEIERLRRQLAEATGR